MKRIAIVGGGITGLSAAFYLKKWGNELEIPLEIKLFEANDRLGGKVHTVKQDGFTMERGADSFLARKKPGMKLMEDLGLEDQLYRNNTGQSYVLVHNQLHKIPAGSYMGIPIQEDALLSSEIMSEEGKARALAEVSRPKGVPVSDQSLGQFLRRRFGDELVDHLLAPLLSGIYSSNVDDMSLMSSFPHFYEYEQKYGSIIKGLREELPERRKGTEKKEGQFVSIQGGLITVIEALEKELSSSIVKNNAIQKVTQENGVYTLYDNQDNTYNADGVILAIPHRSVSGMFEQTEALTALETIPVTSVANVVLAFNKENIEQALDGTGFVVSRTSDVRITACTWTHEKWPSTTPEDKALLRVYVGRPDDQEIVTYSDQEIIDIIRQDLVKVMNIEADPEFSMVTRWQHLMPQYIVGHKEKISQVNQTIASDFPGMVLAGASYNGVGLPDCIADGTQAAADLLDYIKS